MARVQAQLPTSPHDAQLGEGTSVWHLAQVREGAVLGANCVVGRGAYVGTGVRLGDNCKLQNYALVYEPAELEDGVFIGPAVVLTNDLYPRAITPDGGTEERRRLARRRRHGPAGRVDRRPRGVRRPGDRRGVGPGRRRHRRGQGRARLRAGGRGPGPADGLGRPGRRSAGVRRRRTPGRVRRPATPTPSGTGS